MARVHARLPGDNLLNNLDKLRQVAPRTVRSTTRTAEKVGPLV